MELFLFLAMVFAFCQAVGTSGYLLCCPIRLFSFVFENYFMSRGGLRFISSVFGLFVSLKKVFSSVDFRVIRNLMSLNSSKVVYRNCAFVILTCRVVNDMKRIIFVFCRKHA